MLRSSPRRILSVLLILSFVVSIFSLGNAWWSYSANGDGGAQSVSFLPGSMYSVTCSTCGGFSAGSAPYSAIGGSIGGIYEGVFVLVLVSVVLAGIAALLSVPWALGRTVGGWQRSTILLFSGIAPLLMLVAIVWTVSAQPGAFPAGSSYTNPGPGGASPGTSFWGSNAAGTITWGAGIGWYLAVTTIVLLLASVVFFLALGRQRTVVPERRTRSVASAPIVLPRAYTPPPAAVAVPRPSVTRPPPATTATPKPVAAPVPEPVEAPVMLPCPTCGTMNLAKSRTCSYCQRSLRS